MIVVIVALVIIGILYYLNHKRKNNLLLAEQKLHEQRIAALEQEKQLLATEAILKGQDEERRRLAKDLHDGLGGILSSARYSLNDMRENLVISADNASAFDRTMGMLDKSITELRRVAHNMMPESLMNQSLSEALSDTCSQISASGALQVDYIELGMNDVHPDNSVRVAVYRVVQELLNNIVKHAGAASAIVQVIAKDHMLHITVEDKGKGFDTRQLADAAGIGYKNIRNRIDYLKGTIDVRSEDQKGTSVYIEIPL
jgi:signal transduction histidine kinase